MGPSNFQNLRSLDDLQLVHDQLAVGGERNRKVRKRPRRGPCDLYAVGTKLAAMARAGNHVRVRFPLRDAAKVRAHGGHGVKALRHAHDVNLLVLQERDGMQRIKVGITGAKRGGRLEQNIGRKILISHRDRAEARDAERAHGDLVEKIAPRDSLAHRGGLRRTRNRRCFCVAHESRGISSIWTKLGSRSKTSKASMVMVWTGQRSAQRAQRMQIVSSLTITEPCEAPSSAGERCSSSFARASEVEASCWRVSPENSNWLKGTSARQFSGQTSTQPPQRMHSLPLASFPSKIVLIQHCKQRDASLRACSSANPVSTSETPVRRSRGIVGTARREYSSYSSAICVVA